MSQYYKYIGFYLIFINFISFIMFYMDKRKAIKNKYRISENSLILSCALGGSVGAIIAMNIFHHKTRKWKFRIFPGLFLVLQIFIFIRFKQSF